MKQTDLDKFWNELPIGKDNAVSYRELCPVWDKCERDVRYILHDLSAYDNGDNYVLIRSARQGGGFYRTDNPVEIKAYKDECLRKGRSFFAPFKKINRVLRINTTQYTIDNNLRVVRESKGLKQSDVCRRLKDKVIDKAMLSKMENNVCLPTPNQLAALADIYGCSPSELIDIGIYV